MYFIIGGSQGNSEPLSHDHWVELGWVSTKDLLTEVDAFILPNQQTYFDIIALEVLRSGVPLFTTYTGGNKYFEDINNGGVIYVSPSNAKDAAHKILNEIESNIKNLKGKSREIYLKHFTFNSYLSAYLGTIQTL